MSINYRTLHHFITHFKHFHYNCVFSHLRTLPYLCSMKSFNITLPTSWADLSDKQLHMVYSLFARDLSAAEVKTLCLMKWNGLKVLSQLPDKRFLIKRGKVFDKPNEQRKACFISAMARKLRPVIRRCSSQSAR